MEGIACMPELKVTNAHLERDAYLYIRQSTPRQVLENVESTQLQYALRERAVSLGWPGERIHVMDCDLGKTGSHAAGGLPLSAELRRLAPLDGIMRERWHFDLGCRRPLRSRPV